MALDSIRRFSSRVDNYLKYRPSYPSEAIGLLREQCGLGPGAKVADLGSGTGILTALLLDAGAQVFAVEPNPRMRRAAEELLGGRAGFVSVAGTAEASTLEAHSVALVVAGQAFHWFDPGRARREAVRMLAARGSAALLWNEPPEEPTPFLADYEALLRRHAPQYERVMSLHAQQQGIGEFFGGAPRHAVFANRQVLDLQGLEGRLMSSSYAPQPGEPQHEPLIAGLRRLFERHQDGGKVVFAYRTLVFYGQP
jgi:SAM-dependent methyltransferase